MERARKAVKRGEPEGLHDLRVALRRVGATAGALGARPSRANRQGARPFALRASASSQVDRQLLARIGQLGYPLARRRDGARRALGEARASAARRRIARAADGRTMRTLLKERRAGSTAGSPRSPWTRLERARRKAEETLAQPLEGKDDDALHRYRIAVKKRALSRRGSGVLGVRASRAGSSARRRSRKPWAAGTTCDVLPAARGEPGRGRGARRRSRSPPSSSSSWPSWSRRSRARRAAPPSRPRARPWRSEGRAPAPVTSRALGS